MDNNFNSGFKLIIILSIAVGSVILFFFYQIIFAPGGIIGTLK
jgi:hypothetical protein